MPTLKARSNGRCPLPNAEAPANAMNGSTPSRSVALPLSIANEPLRPASARSASSVPPPKTGESSVAPTACNRAR
jgi:hypothetical protein